MELRTTLPGGLPCTPEAEASQSFPTRLEDQRPSGHPSRALSRAAAPTSSAVLGGNKGFRSHGIPGRREEAWELRNRRDILPHVEM